MIGCFMNKKFIGRKSEIANLSHIMDKINDNQSTSGSLIAIDGRRRCGKTTLIEHFIQKEMNSIENSHLTFIYFKFIGNLSLSYKENIVACIINVKSINGIFMNILSKFS